MLGEKIGPPHGCRVDLKAHGLQIKVQGLQFMNTPEFGQNHAFSQFCFRNFFPESRVLALDSWCFGDEMARVYGFSG